MSKTCPQPAQMNVAIASKESRQVCVIGLGNMGSALADALMGGGHTVTVWNRTEAKCAPLAARGAHVAASVTEAAGEADIITICVSDYKANQALLSSKGMERALEGKTLVQFTTMEPERVRAEAAQMHERKVRYLEGAVLGFPSDVRGGSAQMAFSGDRDVFDELKGLIDCLAKTAVHVGDEPGKASTTALLVYSRYYGIAFACLHMAALARAAGIPIQRMLDLLGGNERWQWVGNAMDGFLEMVDRNDYSTDEATLKGDAANYDIYVQLSRKLGVDPAHHTVIGGILNKALDEGWGDMAIPAICEVLSPGVEPAAIS